MDRSFRRAVAIGVLLVVLAPQPGLAQAPLSEMEQLRQEVRELRERLQRIEQPRPAVTPVATPASVPAVPAAAQAPAPAQSPLLTQAPPIAPRPGEREITLEREHPFELLGLPKPELGGVRFSGFF